MTFYVTLYLSPILKCGGHFERNKWLLAKNIFVYGSKTIENKKRLSPKLATQALLDELSCTTN